jgi:hypothetical protein
MELYDIRIFILRQIALAVVVVHAAVVDADYFCCLAINFLRLQRSFFPHSCL